MQLAALLCLLATAVATSPRANFPLDLQLPPVARVGKSYSFQFATTTFQPNPDQLVYSIASGPPWLHIHSENKTLWGTPEAKDVGIAVFTIVAAGEAGSVANMDTRLPVEKDDGPKANGTNIAQALSKLGQLSGPRNVTLLPSKSFNFVLGQDVFESNGKKLSYYATLSDHTPLPSWISFDPKALRFAGTTPLSDSPRTFEILLVASSTPGFAAASASFTLVINDHLLFFKPTRQTVNVTKGQDVNIKGLKDMLYMDNAPIRENDVETASANLPKWLSFDNHSFDISGAPPSGLMSQDISVTVQSKSGGSAEHTIHLAFTSELFVGEIGHLNITPGVYFDQQIPRSILSSDKETVSMEFGKLNKWLRFDAENLIVSGILPETTVAGTIEGSLTATSSDGKTKDTQTFQIDVSQTEANNPSNPLNSDTKDSKSSADSDAASKKKTGIVVGAVLSSLFAAAIFVLLFLSFCRRGKSNQQGYSNSGTPRSPTKRDISHPIPIASGGGEIDRAEYDDLEKGKLDGSPPRFLDRPPQLHLLALPLVRRGVYAHSRETSLNDRDDNLVTKLHESFNFKAENEPIHHPADSMKIPTDILRRKSAGSPDLQRKSTHAASKDKEKEKRRSSGKRRSTRRSHVQSTSRGTNASAAQRTTSSSSHTTALSTVPSAFPQPSRARRTTQLTTPHEMRQSIRSVIPSPYESPERVERLLDRRTIDEKRHSYIRKRASGQQSPLFAGSRISSSMYTSPPDFIGDPGMAHTSSPLKPMSPNIVKSSDTVCGSDNDLPASLRIRKPADTPSPATTNFDLSKSLRKNRPANGLGRRHTDMPSSKSSDADEPPPRSALRPGTAVYQPTGMSSQSSTQASLRGPMIRDTLNKTLGERIFNDAELSESNYSSEEEDIADAERRHTLKPSNSVRNWIGPLKIDRIEEKSEGDSKRDSRRSSKRDSKRNSKRNSKALKRASERDPTPFYRPDRLEHGGKENLPSSLYSLADNSPVKQAPAEDQPTQTQTQTQTRTSTSPNRPKTSTGQQTHRPKVRSRNFSRTITRSPSARTSTASAQALPRAPSPDQRHSRKSLHSRSRSRGGVARPKMHSRSRTQSGAYPRWVDIRASLATSEGDRSSGGATRARGGTLESSTTERDGAGNVVGYGEDEAPVVEELRRESIGVGIGSARNSRVVHMHSSPFYHAQRDRDTAVLVPSTPRQTGAVGLGLSLGGGHVEEDATPGPESAVKGGGVVRESSVASGVEGPEMLRVVEGKGKRPVSVEVDEDPQRRKRLASLKGMLGRGSSIWKSRESKAFL